LAPALTTGNAPGSSDSFEGFLTEVEHGVPDAGQLLLFTGEYLRLEVMLLKHEKNPRVVWGLKPHEDWAFKATLLRFARGRDPVHLILSTEHEGFYQLRGWVVQRTWDSFRAAPLPPEQTKDFWERCLTPFYGEQPAANPASDSAESVPQPEASAEP
jgi:hypothetical protein